MWTSVSPSLKVEMSKTVRINKNAAAVSGQFVPPHLQVGRCRLTAG